MDVFDIILTKMPNSAHRPVEQNLSGSQSFIQKSKRKVEKSAKPFLKWAGGKTQLINDIKKSLPTDIIHNKFTYIEPFVGSGALASSSTYSPRTGEYTP